jgi:ubiquinol-cytochrome c reductase iron-sulfur subunit
MNQNQENNVEQINESNEDTSTRRDFVVLTASAVACAGAAAAAIPFVKSLAPDKAVLAVGSTEVDISKIKEGETITVMWRGQPVFIKHRTNAEIEAAKATKLEELVDPQEDDLRVKKGKEKWLVTVGVCTHLGCVPLNNKGDFKGWFCPCHGSHYDTSGRIRKGPAPKNLAIPPYEFLNDNTIKIG